jgi:hypothetical protein
MKAKHIYDAMRRTPLDTPIKSHPWLSGDSNWKKQIRALKQEFNKSVARTLTQDYRGKTIRALCFEGHNLTSPWKETEIEVRRIEYDGHGIVIFGTDGLGHQPNSDFDIEVIE